MLVDTYLLAQGLMTVCQRLFSEPTNRCGAACRQGSGQWSRPQPRPGVVHVRVRPRLSEPGIRQHIARHRETHHPIYSDPTELQVHGNASGAAVLALARTFLLRSRCIGRTALAGLALICPLLAGLTLICPLLEGSRVRHHHQAPRNAAPNACAAPKGCRTRSKCPI